MGDVKIGPVGKGRERIVSAKSFKGTDGYVFPFVAIDPDTSGRSLGRIEWNIEVVPARKHGGQRMVSGVVVWTNQTRDPRYVGKSFLIPMRTSCLSFPRFADARRGFTMGVWRVGFCPTHDGNLILSAYPENRHTKLVVQTSSSIGNDIYFE